MYDIDHDVPVIPQRFEASGLAHEDAVLLAALLNTILVEAVAPARMVHDHVDG